MRNKILMTLALLITAAGGAWATDVYVVGNGDGNWLNDAIWDPGVAGNKMTEQNGVYSITFKDVDANSELLFKFAINGSWNENFGCTSWDANELNKTLSNIEALGNNIMFGLTEKADVTISFNLSELTYMISTKGMKVGDDADPNAVEVTTNAAEEGATFTEASFEMPTSDVTVNYELVRDMSVQMTTKVGDGADGADYRIRLKKKDGNKWEPAELTVAQVMEKFKVHDAIENKDLAFYGEGAVCAISIYAADDNDQPTGNAIDFADLEPGRYVAIATAADGTAYDGQTAQSNVFELYEGFPVVVPATEEEGGEVDLGTVSFYTEQFNLKLETGSSAKLYTLTAIDGHTVTATEVDVVPAGMPFFVLNETDAEQMVTLLPATAEEVTTTPTPIIEFLGTDVDLTFTQEDMDGAYDYYILHRGIFVWVKDPGTLKAGKCYLRILKGQPTTARRIVFSEATGLRAIENGKLTIENEAGAVYDLSGRRVAAPTKKGVYIQNGRKVVR